MIKFIVEYGNKKILYHFSFYSNLHKISFITSLTFENCLNKSSLYTKFFGLGKS